SPPARAGHAIASDPSRRILVLFGGMDGDSRPAGTWHFDSGTGAWSRPERPPEPSPRRLHSMSFDAGSGKVVMFGGDIGGGETWSYSAESVSRVSPAVLSTVPRMDELRVSQSTKVVVEFDQPMDPVMTLGAFSISPEVKGGGAGVRGRFLEWTHPGDLESYATYTVSVSDSARSLSGDRLREPYVFSFKTRGRVPEVSIRPAPFATDVPSDATIMLDFSERMEPVSTVSAFAINASHPLEFVWEPDLRTLKATPVTPFTSGARYEIRLSTAAVSEAGEPLGYAFRSVFTVARSDAADRAGGDPIAWAAGATLIALFALVILLVGLAQRRDFRRLLGMKEPRPASSAGTDRGGATGGDTVRGRTQPEISAARKPPASAAETRPPKKGTLQTGDGVQPSTRSAAAQKAADRRSRRSPDRVGGAKNAKSSASRPPEGGEGKSDRKDGP
ncbi:MAG TPA: Ig-like domain-containing protein, partial [Thermoplasmata archaeon]|nr:Ig-like domain-containing protein [Thermoplasmata archaeon]